MDRWERLIDAVGPLRVVTALGVLFVVLGAGRSILFWQAGVPILWTLDGFVFTSASGIVLLYGRFWLSRSDIDSDQYSRIAVWTVLGLEAMLVVFGLIAINPFFEGISRPFFTPLIATGVGSLAGFLVGVYNARAIGRARESEKQREKFRSERDLRERIVEASATGILVVNADRSIRLANERAAEIIGSPVDELLETEYDDLQWGQRETDDDRIDTTLDTGTFQHVLTTGETVYNEERRIAGPDGRDLFVSLHGAPLHDPDGEIIAVVFALENITERKQLEAELKETVARLEESNERLEQFAYAASHDLQEPLRMITNYLQLLEDRYRDDLDEDAQEFIDFAVDGAERMRAMIDNLLDYSRISTEGAPLEPVDAEAVLADVRTDLQRQIEETDAEITADDLPTVTADEDQLAQVFRNLISNALKYSGDEPPRVHVSAERAGEEWQFAVADQGVGIDPDFRDRIFEVFETVHTDEEGAGSGIGLAICQRIVDRHGGEIWVESEPGEGTTVYFTVPLTEEQHWTPDADSRPAPN